LRRRVSVGPGWKRALGRVGVVGCGMACAANPAPPRPAPESHSSTDSVAVWPAATAQADASNGVVMLSSPRSRRAARELVRAFFEAVRRESVSELSALLDEGATISSGPGSAPEPVPKVWAARFKRLDYGLDGAKEPYRPDELGVFTAEELLQLDGTRRYELAPAAGELLAVVIPRDRPSPTGPRYFGRRIELILGPTPAGLRILRMFEDFRLP